MNLLDTPPSTDTSWKGWLWQLNHLFLSPEVPESISPPRLLVHLNNMLHPIVLWGRWLLFLLSFEIWLAQALFFISKRAAKRLRCQNREVPVWFDIPQRFWLTWVTAWPQFDLFPTSRANLWMVSAGELDIHELEPATWLCRNQNSERRISDSVWPLRLGGEKDKYNYLLTVNTAHSTY